MSAAPRTDSGVPDLTNCDREPIHIPGSIQPHGVLLALQPDTFEILQASENVAQHLDVPVKELLGKALSAVLEESSFALMRDVCREDLWDESNPLPIKSGGKRFDGVLHCNDGMIILEMEPAEDITSAQQAQRLLSPVLKAFQSVDSLSELRETAVREVRRLTGFDRVMLYHFDEEGHGSVDAEVKAPDLQPYLGLHYPASDIPRQARALYLKNLLRIIPDAGYAPARILPELRPDTGEPLDLGKSILRSVSPVHLEYMANMGVRASMSISLALGGTLWGLIACTHHSGARFVPYQVRAVCEVLGRLAAMEIGALEERDATDFRLSRGQFQQPLSDAMRAGGLGEDLLGSLFDRPDELLKLVDASSAAVVCGDAWRTIGVNPPKAFMSRLADWIDANHKGDVYATAELSAEFAPAAEHKDHASGVLSFTLPGTVRRRLFWFRPEVVRTVNWGGDPRKPVSGNPDGRLHPRRSFEIWKQQVRLTSRKWGPGEIEAAVDLRRAALEIDLAHQVQREHQAVLARENVLAVVSHDLRNPLSVVKMQGALLRSLRDSGTAAQGGDISTIAERVERAVEKMDGLIENLLDMARLEAGQFPLTLSRENANDMVAEAIPLLRPLAEAKGVALNLQLDDCGYVKADRKRFFQVISNLVGNSVKFTPEGGSVVIETAGHGKEILFTVSDSGPGIPAEELPHLFNRYWRAKHGGDGGAGLGLFVCKGIVDAHGGRIWAENVGGAALRFTLPRA